jgi:hypothetical protein
MLGEEEIKTKERTHVKKVTRRGNGKGKAKK